MQLLLRARDVLAAVELALIALVAATTLSVYEPRGMLRRGSS